MLPQRGYLCIIARQMENLRSHCGKKLYLLSPKALALMVDLVTVHGLPVDCD